jgi:putative MATE family efflux protein
MLRLAVPAFAALVSEPMFLLADTAVVGHLGTTPLAALTVAATVVQTVVGLCVFLAYGTTATVGRRLGAGDMRGAIGDGVAGGWLALLIGAGLAVLLAATSTVLPGLFGVSGDVADQAGTYLLLAAPGIPAMLVVLAATGVLRGLQDTRTPLVVLVAANLANIVLNIVLVYGVGLGLAGSALGTTLAQLGAAVAMATVVVRAARRHGAPLRPDRAGVLRAVRLGTALFVRTLTLRAVLLMATAVAGTMPAASLAAQQIAVAVVTALAFGLDAIAIAAQAIVGRRLGAGEVDATRRTTRRMLGWGLATGVIAGVGVLAVSPWLAWAFTTDPDVRSAAVGALVVVALSQPLSGVVFVLDGVLIGAGDGRYLAWAGVATLVVYVPCALAVLVTGVGLGWLWAAYGAWIAARAITLLARERSEAWLVTGAALPARTTS